MEIIKQFQLSIEIVGDYYIIKNVPGHLVTKLSEELLYHRGSYKDEFNYIVIDYGVSKGSDLYFPIKKILLLTPIVTEDVPNALPFRNIQYYLTGAITELGRGNYGKVSQVGNYAIKTFLSSLGVDNPWLDYSFLRESSALAHLKQPNIVKLIDIVSGEPNDPLNDIVSIILPLADYNLQRYIRKYGNSKRRLIVYELLKGFDYLQKKDIVHGDIKPDNILIYLDINDPNYFSLRITDFGLSIPTSCQPGSLKGTPYNPYFRGPEILFKFGYGLPADLWAIGCLIYFVYTESFLFYIPGDNTLSEDQLAEAVKHRIFNTLGSPQHKWLELYKHLIDNNLGYTFNIDTNKIKLKVNNDDIFLIIMKLLEYNPYTRIHISEALKNPIFSIFPDYSMLLQDLDCPGIVNQRQKYQNISSASSNTRIRVSNKIYDRLSTKGYNVTDYFAIMYIFDYAYPGENIFQLGPPDHDSDMLFLAACAEIYYFYKYGQGLLRSSKVSISDPYYNYIKKLDYTVKLILNIINFDLIYTSLTDFIDQSSKVDILYGKKAIEKGLCFKYLSKDIYEAIRLHQTQPAYFNIISELI